MSLRSIPVAVIGAGPAGFFAAEALLKDPRVRVDLFERLPAPFGLVRYGVAPDHQTIKKVENAFTALTRDPRLRLFCNVEIGKHVSIAELQEHYWQTVFACGCGAPRRLGVEGEQIPGVHHALEFVSWYNGHPDYATLAVDLGGVREAVVIGGGDVSLDVTRLLLSEIDLLRRTDMTDFALRQFERAAIERVHLVIRRGPAQTGFALKELRAISERPEVRLSADVELIRQALEEDLVTSQKAKLQYLLQACELDNPQARFELRFHFLRSPHAFISDASGRLSGLRVGTNRLVIGADGQVRAEDTLARDVLPAQLAIVAAGYRASSIPGLPFDEARGNVPNRDGRVLGAPPPGRLHVVGWMRRGSSGVIGTNKSDARQVVQGLLQDEPPAAALPDPQAIVALLEERGVPSYGAEQWHQIDAFERASGLKAGKPREKLYRLEDMLAVLERGAAS